MGVDFGEGVVVLVVVVVVRKDLDVSFAELQIDVWPNEVSSRGARRLVRGPHTTMSTWGNSGIDAGAARYQLQVSPLRPQHATRTRVCREIALSAVL